MARTVVTENIADPVNSPAHRVAWLIFVNIGEITGLLAVPRLVGRGIVRWHKK